MYISKGNHTAELSEDILTEGQFSIAEEDMHIIFSILRDKMYKDPIASICREISCNSRDANREIENELVPIEISIENVNALTKNSDLSISFKDCGPGISPNRMKDIFLKYGASTKRLTNTFTGGYGLGSKTPFAYTDSFSIITIHNGIKYFYNAFIDESEKGKIILFDKTESNECSGTEIIIPLKNNSDRYQFENACLTYTNFWSIKPVFKNFNTFNTTPVIPIYTGKGFYYQKYRNSNIILLIDEIPYFIDNISTINLDKNLICNGLSIIIPFENGELSLSANRETIHLNESTIEKSARTTGTKTNCAIRSPGFIVKCS